MWGYSARSTKCDYITVIILKNPTFGTGHYLILKVSP